MEPKTARIYYLPPLSTRFKQIEKAQLLLESRGWKVKVVEARLLTTGDRRALEQAGHSYPAVQLNETFIDMDQLEVTLDGLSASPSTTAAIGARRAAAMAQNDFLFGVSPPGPQSIWVAPSDSASDSSSPRRFINVDDNQDDAPSEEEEAVKLPKPHSPFPYPPNVEPSPFDPPFEGGLALEEIGIGDSQEIHGSPLAAPSQPFQPKNAPAAPHTALFGDAPPSKPVYPIVASSSQGDLAAPKPAAPSVPQVPISPVALDPRTERLIWLFNGIKQYCESAEFKRAVNLLGKTADMVESQARSLWNFFGWGSSSSSSPAAAAVSTSPSSSAPISANQNNSSLTPPPDTETTLTLLVVRTNWYGRDQYRFLRLDPTALVRLRTDNYEECERTPYETLIAAQVSGSTIRFRYAHGETPSEIAYNFGDSQVARMIADSLQFLKGKGSVAVSYIGN